MVTRRSLFAGFALALASLSGVAGLSVHTETAEARRRKKHKKKNNN